MLRTLAGLALAALAAAAYGCAVVLQAAGARAASAPTGGVVQVARRVVARRRWQLGAAVGVAGWPLQAGALLLAPLVVVQPALALGLVVMLAGSWLTLGERPRRADGAAVVVIAVAVGAIAAAAPPGGRLPGGLPGVAILAVLGGAASVPLVASARFARRGRVNAAAAGAMYAASGIATKHLADTLGRRDLPPAAAWIVVVVLVSAAGTVLEMVSYRAAPVALTAPLTFVLELALPTALALATGERPSSAPAAVVLVAAATLLVAATASLARSPAVDVLIGEARSAG